MSEIELLYKNAGVEKRAYYNSCPKGQYLSNNLTCYECEYFSTETPYLKCSYRVYPPFTGSKQLELIKWLAKHYGNIHILNNASRGFAIGIEGVSFNLKKFEEIIAMVLNTFWQDLTESEQEQIRSILNG